MHTSIHAYIPTCIHTYIQTYINTNIQTYKRTYIYTYIYTYIHKYKHTYIKTHIHTYIHSYIHMYIHTHIHLPMRKRKSNNRTHIIRMRNSTRWKGSLIAAVAKTDNWPIKKDTLIKRDYKAFARFAKTMDKINEINTVKEEQ